MSLWGFGGNSFNITGYTFAFWGNSTTIKLASEYQNSKLLSELHTNSLPPIVPYMDDVANRELIADVMISQGPTTTPISPANNFDNVVGGFFKPHLSAHLKSRVPVGQNIVFKDGHAQWRKVNTPSTNPTGNITKIRTGGNTPYFWW